MEHFVPTLVIYVPDLGLFRSMFPCENGTVCSTIKHLAPFGSEFSSVNGTYRSQIDDSVPLFSSSSPWMEHIVPKLGIWEEISDHFFSFSYFIPKLRSLLLKETIGQAQTCLGKFGCTLLSWILHNSNEGGQVRACIGRYKYICSSFICHRLLQAKCS